MREIDARVTGFDYSTFHAYTTEVEVDGRTWTLGIRYNTFYQFYTRLAALEKHFTVDFPPKGGLFFSPPPEERQEQLDDFLLSTLAYFDMRGHPRRMESLLGELLQIPDHLGIKDDDERTASEGSSVAEELLLDTPMAGHTADDFTESGVEDDDHEVHEDQTEEDGHKVEVEVDHQEVHVDEFEVAPVEFETKIEVAAVELEEKQPAIEEKKEENQQEAEDVLSPKTEVKVQPLQEGEQLKGGAVAKKYIAMLRRKTLVDGAIQAAVVSTMKETVEKAKAKKAVEQKPVEEVKEIKTETVEEETAKEEVVALKLEEPEAPVAEEELSLAAPLEAAVQAETTAPEPTAESAPETSVAVLEVVTTVAVAAVEVEEPAVSSASATEKAIEVATVSETEQNSVAEESAPASELETEAETEEASSTESVEAEEQSEEESATDPSQEEPEAENPVVSWFRSTFGPSTTEKEAQDAADAAKKEQEEKEVAARAEAEAKAESEGDKAEAEAAAKAEAEEAELLRQEQELNLRLKLYRHPVFFQGFNCDVGTSRYLLPARVSDGIVV